MSKKPTSGSALAEMRERRGLTQEELANATGASISSIRNYEGGKSTPKGYKRQKALADALGVTHDRLREAIGHLTKEVGELRIGNGETDTYDESPFIAPLKKRQPFTNNIYSMEVPTGSGTFLDEQYRVGALRSKIEGVFRVEVIGDSMYPTLREGMVLRAYPFLGRLPDVKQDGVYIFRLEHAYHIKRLQILPGGRVRVISDNTLYPPYEIQLDDAVDFEVFGLIKL